MEKCTHKRAYYMCVLYVKHEFIYGVYAVEKCTHKQVYYMYVLYTVQRMTLSIEYTLF